MNRECDCCGVELEADPPHAGEHENLCHQCNQEENLVTDTLKIALD